MPQNAGIVSPRLTATGLRPPIAQHFRSTFVPLPPHFRSTDDNPSLTMTALQYLDFDYSEDDEGTGTWDAIASVPAGHLAALQTEIVQVLTWATNEFPGLRGPVEEGGVWDYDLHSEPEDAPLQTLHYDPASRRLLPEISPETGQRHILTLSISGHAEFAAALRGAFDLN